MGGGFTLNGNLIRTPYLPNIQYTTDMVGPTNPSRISLLGIILLLFLFTFLPFVQCFLDMIWPN